MQRFILTIVGVLIFCFMAWGTAYFYSQTKPFETRAVPFFKNSFEVIAHRGGSLEAPENTLKAFDNATSLSPDIVLEFDIHLTADDKLVVFHDETLDRTTNGTGQLKKKTLEELKSLDAAYNFKNNAGEFSMRSKGVQIPTLEEVLQKYPNTRMIIEVKPNSIDASEALYAMLQKYQRIDRTLMSSEHSPVIKFIKRKDANIYTAAGKDEILRSVMLENLFLEKLDPMNADAYCIPEKHDGITVLTKRLLAELSRRGKKAFIWTINNPDDMKRLKDLGVDGIITDHPKALLSITHN